MRLFNLKTLPKLQRIALGEILGTIPSDAYFGLRKKTLFNYILASKDKEFIERISSNFVKFNIETKIHRRKTGLWYIEVCRRLFVDLLPYLNKEDGKWIYSKKIVNCSIKEFKAALIRSFADAEGSTTCKIDNGKFFSRRIVLYNSSKTILLQLQQMLNSFNIKSFIRLDRSEREALIRGKNFKFRDTYSLRITHHKNLKLFYQLIGFNISRKNDLLKRMLDSYRYIGREYLPRDYHKVLTLYKKLKNCREVSRRLKIPPQTVQNWALLGIMPRSLKIPEYQK